MNVGTGPSASLNDCGCCEGLSVETPARVNNRPGLSAIAYRVGTHPQFKATMIAQLSGAKLAALNGLSTRDDADFTIALLDACAVVGDVLTFYQERIANEVYLRTATERLSVLELARLIDYQLRPGVAAGTYLAFTLEDAPGALGQALSLGTTAQSSAESLPPLTIKAGVKAQSVPAPGEQAQTFETVEAIEARPAWNAIRPRLTRPQNDASFLTQSVVLRGVTTGVKEGDTLLVESPPGVPVTRTVVRVKTDDLANTTRVDFVSSPPQSPSFSASSALPAGSIDDFPTKVELDESVVQQILAKRWDGEDLTALAEIQGWPQEAVISAIERETASAAKATLPKVHAFRQQVAVFGHNAPAYISLFKPNGTSMYPHNWDSSGFEIWRDSLSTAATAAYYTKADLYLDRQVTGVSAGTYVVLQKATATGAVSTIYKSAAVVDQSLAGFGVSGKATGLKLAKLNGSALANNSTDKPTDLLVRGTLVLLQPEELPLADLQIDDPIQGDTIQLDRTYLGLRVGQRVVLTGDRDDLKGTTASELRALEAVTMEGGFTLVRFDRPLDYTYQRQQPRALGDLEPRTVTINANVAPATHGDTVRPESLGGGNGEQEFQRFTLRQPPLTYVSAPTPSGAATTLSVRVNDVLWDEVSSFFGHGPEERIYVTRQDDEGKTTVTFGDGRTGARLPTGQENVVAYYRKGIGRGGVLKADRLTQLMSKPLGVKGVTNPVPATGAADPERLDDARRNAPLTVLTLGRIVSLKDYEDFARAFSGIDKALATWTWFGERRGIFVTVAGSDGAEVEEGSMLYDNLLKGMQAAGDTTVPLIVRSYQPRFFRVSAGLHVDPKHLPEKVVAGVEQALRAAFAFRARDFGQPVHFSDVVAAIQNVTGVVAVDVDTLHRSDLAAGAEPEAHIAAAAPAQGASQVQPAELLTLDPRPIDLEVLK